MLSTIAFFATCASVVLLAAHRNWLAALWAMVAATYALERAIPYLISLGG